MFFNSEIVLNCKIILHRGENTGLRNPIKNHARPSFGINNMLIACDIDGEGLDFLPLEEEFNAKITLAYSTDVGLYFKGDEVFTLNIASTKIGEGRILNIVKE